MRTHVRSDSAVIPRSVATEAYVRFPAAARKSATASLLNSSEYGDLRPTWTSLPGPARSIVRVSTPEGQPHLGSWPAAPDDWPRLVRPTLYEVTGLCAALSFATNALDLSNRLAGV